MIVIIAHSQTLLTWYAHVDNSVHPPAVTKGEFVHQGQVIAYEGRHRQQHGPAPALGGGAERDVRQPAAVPRRVGGAIGRV